MQKILVLVSVWLFVSAGISYSDILQLMDDDATVGKIIDTLTTVGEGGQGPLEMDESDGFRDNVSVILPVPEMYGEPNWAYPIKENPKAGEYRFMTVAWKKEPPGNFLMIQLSGVPGGWEHRFHAGDNTLSGGFAAGSIQLPEADTAPTEWTFNVVDLFELFGEFTIDGMALDSDINGAGAGKAAHFDAIYLTQTREEAEMKGILAVDVGGKLTITWGNIKEQ